MLKEFFAKHFLFARRPHIEVLSFLQKFQTQLLDAILIRNIIVSRNMPDSVGLIEGKIESVRYPLNSKNSNDAKILG
jgi:hypothetical protein